MAYHCSFVVSCEIGMCMFFHFVLLEDCFGYLESLIFPNEF